VKPFETLKNYLQSETDAGESGVTETILCLAQAMIQISQLVARGPLAGAMGAARGDNADGDVQKELDIVANDAVVEALQDAPISCLVSEEFEEPLLMRPNTPLYVAIDPLDGSSNIETNAAVGTIFAIFPAINDKNATVEAGALQPGVNQLAAGYCIYGPQTSLVLTIGNGTHIFTLDPDEVEFRLTSANVRISETTREFAINVSNFRHWDRHVRAYVDDCLAGEEGHRKSNYNMRWIASLVAECQRILARGGIFLYPGDARKGYAHGRLRLLYECSPIAFLIEQAGGGATTGKHRVMEVVPENIHQRVPMIFGSSREIRRVERYYAERDMHGERSQLFNKRGLFRAS
jgi:fructose-1,6-bisphosphatase I